MLVVEVGLKLDKDFEYYDSLLKENGLINDFKTITHDIYYTNKNLKNMSENEMKNSCLRLRSCDEKKYIIQNNNINELEKEIYVNQLNDFEKKIESLGYHKVFDTRKKDYHYWKENMVSKIQIQQIENIGLLVYYDNKNYYKYDLEQQRKMLIKELNSYGFNFENDVLGLDKLRTLYYKKEMYSKNQNG